MWDTLLCIREGNGTPLQYSCLENPMDGGVWWAAVHGLAKSRTQLSEFTFTFHFHALEKEMATHSSVLAWRIPGMGEPGGLLSMGSHRVAHDWSDLASVAAASLYWQEGLMLNFTFNIQNIGSYMWREISIQLIFFQERFRSLLTFIPLHFMFRWFR